MHEAHATGGTAAAHLSGTARGEERSLRMHGSASTAGSLKSASYSDVLHCRVGARITVSTSRSRALPAASLCMEGRFVKKRGAG